MLSCSFFFGGGARRCPTRRIALQLLFIRVYSLADARPAACRAAAFLAVVLADARPAALLALASCAVTLADARPAVFLVLDFFFSQIPDPPHCLLLLL